MRQRKITDTDERNLWESEIKTLSRKDTKALSDDRKKMGEKEYKVFN